MKELKHDILPDIYCDISLMDDELAIAGGYKEKLLLFSIEVKELGQSTSV